MAETHETVADITAEMRDEAARADMEQGYSLDDAAEMMREFASRLEAAHKRGRGVAVTGSNQLRETLRLCMGAMCKYCVADAEARGLPTECVHGCEALLMAKAALAAPPRNCDKVKTSWDVLKKWHEGLDTANDIVRMLDWLLAPATEKEGAAK